MSARRTLAAGVAALLALAAIVAGSGLLPAGPALAAPPTNSVVFPGVGKNGTFPAAQNVGTQAADITFEFYGPLGTRIDAATIVLRSVDPGEMRQIDPALIAAVPDGFFGTVVASSTSLLVGASPRAIDPPGGRAWAASNGYPYPAPGLAGFTLPFLANRLDGVYTTRMIVVNAGNAAACVTIGYAFQPGIGSVGAGGRAPLVDQGPGGGGCASGYPLPVHGQLVFQADAEVGRFAYPPATRNTQMAATVTSSGSPIYAVAEAFVAGGNVKYAAYDGFQIDDTGAALGDLGKEIYIPLALKTADGFYTQILMSNTTNNAAQVTITYRGPMGVYPVTMTIPAHATANHSVYSDNVVPVGFVGAAFIDSSEAIAAVLFRAKMTAAFSYVDEDIYTAVNGIPRRKAAKELAVPVVRRRLAGVSSWVSVVVDGGGPAHLTLRWAANRAGDVACPGNESRTRTRTVTGTFIFYLNLDADNGLDAAPECFSGSLVIVSDVPIFAISSLIHPDSNRDPDAVINAIPIR